MPMSYFVSDNTSPMAPQLLDALRSANDGNAPSYAADAWTTQLRHRVSALFERDVAVFITSTGTAANALSIATLCPPWKQTLCHRFSHVMENEAGAPEAASGGGKLRAPSRASDRLSPEDVRLELDKSVTGDPHTPYLGLVTVAQATEAGTLYSRDELNAIGSIARNAGARFHMDGARFANALVTMKTTPAEISWRVGLDALSLGAAKNGGALGDLIVLFDLERAEEMRYRQMRAGQLAAKNRFAAAQMLAYFEDGLWLRLAHAANAMSTELGRRLVDIGLELAAPVQANEVFVLLPGAVAEALKRSGQPLKLVAPDRFSHTQTPVHDLKVARFVTSWDTRLESIAGVIEQIARHQPS